MPKTNQAQTIKKAINNKDKLNDWENGFIATLSRKQDDYELSDKQVKTLNKIGQKLI